MKKSKKLKPKKNNARGPLARKVIESAKQELQKNVVELSVWKNAQICADDYQKSIVSQDALKNFDPLHALYIYGQNQLSVLIEQIAELPILDKLASVYADATDEYMPSRPPMSPHTNSYFSSWGAFDLCSNGAKKETLCTVATDFCKFMNVDPGLIEIYEEMQKSKMGIYKLEGVSDRFVTLRELITNKKIQAISGSGYKGIHIGEIWFVRVLPPLFDAFNYSVVFTTPYVIGKFGIGGEFMPHVENNWLAYFERNLYKTNIQNKQEAYHTLMKYGFSHNYWNEYIFLSYRNHRDDMILLEGIPDIPSSMPHTQEGRQRLGID